ncbi:MAG: hypothetical protein OXE50_14665 [Chloroflexi bacterium]|nr:hypothetical protein [Chloroflexota bacterium]
MNITSYNVTDVGYHYIGLRVLGGLPANAKRDDQTGTIARSVRKYAYDKSLRLMLPEPRGTFDTVGEKVCQELVHLHLAKAHRGEPYNLTEEGNNVLSLLNNQDYRELRQVMAIAHLRTYDNLRAVMDKYLTVKDVWQPIVETEKISQADYIARLLEPTFGADASEHAKTVRLIAEGLSPKRLEDKLRKHVLQTIAPENSISVSMYRSMADRLVSLRLLNLMRDSRGGCEFDKSYTPCVKDNPPYDWYSPLEFDTGGNHSYVIYFCEPNMADEATQSKLLGAIINSFEILTSAAGYYTIPEVRDTVCASLRIPEGAFDEGLNRLLDFVPCPFTVGLQYEHITARRKPLVRERGAAPINLIRRS